MPTLPGFGRWVPNKDVPTLWSTRGCSECVAPNLHMHFLHPPSKTILSGAGWTGTKHMDSPTDSPVAADKTSLTRALGHSSEWELNRADTMRMRWG
jgi:hypothetical protein